MPTRAFRKNSVEPLEKKAWYADDIDAVLERALDYVKAKNSSADWIKASRNALNRFRCFLRQERGYADVVIKSPNLERYALVCPAGWSSR